MTSIKLKFRPSTLQEKEGCLYFQVIYSRKVRQIQTECFIFPLYPIFFPIISC